MSVIKDAMQRLEAVDAILTHDRTFSLAALSKIGTGVMNILQNGVSTDTLEEPKVWLTLFHKNLGRNEKLFSEVTHLILRSGEHARRTVRESLSRWISLSSSNFKSDPAIEFPCFRFRRSFGRELKSSDSSLILAACSEFS